MPSIMSSSNIFIFADFLICIFWKVELQRDRDAFRLSTCWRTPQNGCDDGNYARQKPGTHWAEGSEDLDRFLLLFLAH